MAEVLRPDGARIHYEVHGTGHPVLLLAPGLTSRVGSWAETFWNPVADLAAEFQVVAMDQRHAGRSAAAPFAPFDYATSAGDQLAVLDAAGVDRAHLVGAGVGAAHALRLAHDAPERVGAVVCQEPVGRDGTNTLGTFFSLFDEAMRVPRAASFDEPDETAGLAAVIEAARREPRFDLNPGAGPFAQRLHDDPAFVEELLRLRRESYVTGLVRFRDGMWPDGAAFFSVPDAWVPTLAAPLLVLPGHDERHPEGVAKRLATEVPGAELIEVGFDVPAAQASTVDLILHFLRRGTAA